VSRPPALSSNGDDIMARLPYSPARGRPPIRWPDGAHVAVWVAVNTEHYEFVPAENPHHRAYPRVPAPDVQQYALRDYGNRVGIWRLAELLDDYPIPVTASLSVGVLDLFAEIGELLVDRRWDCMSHGMFNTRAVFGYPAERERAELDLACSTFLRHTGEKLRGMLGPTVSMTSNTFDLMAECGMTYTADVFHDDQPAPVLTRAGRLVSVPYTVDLNDGNLFAEGAMEVFAARWAAQLDRLSKDGAESGTVACLALHPYIVGRPDLIGTVRRLLDDLAGREQVWCTTARAIAETYLVDSYDEQLEFALRYAAHG
jgi:peptidoglycan/xylan/chitin deacetylase (PgdA/CDA1 family)